MFGDATRTPIILETTQMLFGKTETSRTLNSIDAIARGAALQSAFLSPAFNTGVFKVEEFNHLPVEVIYGDIGSTDTKNAVMFPAKLSKIPNKKSITFNNKVGNMEVQLKYAEGAEILEGLPSIIAQYTVNEAKLKHAEKDKASHELAYEIENTLHQIPVLKEANIIEKWQEEEKIAIKKVAPPKPAEAKPAEAKPEEKKDEAKPAEEAAKEAEKPAPETVQEYETKIRNKQTTSAINFSFSFFGLVPEDLKKGIEAEALMHLLDRKYLDLKESKNALETVCYKYRESLQNKMGPFLEEQAKAAVIAELTKTVDWLYGEGEESTFQEYTKRYTDFMKVLEPVKKRSIFHEEIPERFALFETCRKWTVSRLESPELSHLTEEQRKSVNDKLAIAVEFMGNVQAELAKIPKHQDCSTSVNEVDNKLRAMKAEIDPILATPVPKPAEEPKAEEKKDEAKPDEPMDGAAEAKPEDAKQ